MERGSPHELIGDLVDAVGLVRLTHPTRVAIDGPPASGKTTLADKLALVLREQGREVIRATIDDFLFPRAHRYRRGMYSAEGCYFDAHDYDSLNRVLLDPLGPGGDRCWQQAIYDHSADAVLPSAVRTAPTDAVLVFDGVFLMREELIDRWDLRIFVLTAFETTVDRAVMRERPRSSAAEVERRWRERYIPAQQLYFANVHPLQHADIVVHNDHPEQPGWDRRAH